MLSKQGPKCNLSLMWLVTPWSSSLELQDPMRLFPKGKEEGTNKNALQVVKKQNGHMKR